MADYRGINPVLILLVAKLERAMTVCGHELMGEAQRQAPVREGILRASAAVEVRRTGPYEVTAAVSFNTVYAARQHENLHYRHPKGGKAKYLEDPLKAYPLPRRLRDEMAF
jgi:hypothetical protein